MFTFDITFFKLNYTTKCNISCLHTNINTTQSYASFVKNDHNVKRPLPILKKVTFNFKLYYLVLH